MFAKLLVVFLACEMAVGHVPRLRRQVGGSVTLHDTSAVDTALHVPIAGSDTNKLSAVGGLSLNPQHQLSSVTGGLSLDNINGHNLLLTKTHIPKIGDQLTAAGKLSLVNNPNHDLSANAFITRNMPSAPQAPNYNTVGGGLDYMYKNRIGASLGAQHTDLFKQTDYSAAGKLNLFHNPTTSLDFKAGVQRSFSPYIPSRSWEPFSGFSFTKRFQNF